MAQMEPMKKVPNSHNRAGGIIDVEEPSNITPSNRKINKIIEQPTLHNHSRSGVLRIHTSQTPLS